MYPSPIGVFLASLRDSETERPSRHNSQRCGRYRRSCRNQLCTLPLVLERLQATRQVMSLIARRNDHAHGKRGQRPRQTRIFNRACGFDHANAESCKSSYLSVSAPACQSFSRVLISTAFLSELCEFHSVLCGQKLLFSKLGHYQSLPNKGTGAMKRRQHRNKQQAIAIRISAL